MRLRDGHPRELLVLVLVAFATVTVVNVANPQDATRYELTRSIALHGSLSIQSDAFDRAVYSGRTYSDKAPGMSFLAVPAYAVERAAGVARTPATWAAEGDLSLWAVRIATSGLLFLLACVLVGRAAESLVAGTGAAVLATFGTATLAGPLAPTFFEHDAAAFWAFAGFLLAWRRRRADVLVLAGLALGVGVLFQYATFSIAVIVAAYSAVVAGRRALWLVAGSVLPFGALAAYDAAAFGSPLHLSYRYVANRFQESQGSGFFGVGIPTWSGLGRVLVGDRGLLVFSPVLLAATLGLWLMWRSGHRAEAAVAVAVTCAFVLADGAYFLPYGGNSPGPRFVAPALPFLMLGLPFALRRFPTTTVALAVVSCVLTTIDSLTWGLRGENDAWYPGSGTNDLAKSVWVWLGLDRIAAGGLVGIAALAAVTVAAAPLLRRDQDAVKAPDTIPVLSPP